MPEIALQQFHGGLHPDQHKDESHSEKIITLALPKQIILPIKQHIGGQNKILVAVGDAVKTGQLLASSKEFISASVHASTSGIVSAIEQRAVPHASAMSDWCIVIDVDFKDEPLLNESLLNESLLNESLHNDPSSNEPSSNEPSSEQLLNAIKHAGIVGLGGAAFPTAAKISSSKTHIIDTLLINGAECEPFITCDDALMQNHADTILKGIFYLQKIVKPKHTFIGIEDNKQQAIKAMQLALNRCPLAHTTIAKIPTVYPSGGEKQLIKILTGKEVPSHKFAFDIAVICQNVGTCFAIAEAIDQQQAIISRVVTVSGKGIHNPANYLVRLGTPIADLIKAAGGYTQQASHLVMGGPMMGFTLPHDQLPVIKSSNAVLALSEEFNLNQATQACIRCGQCAEVCPANLLPQQLFWYARSNSFDRIQEYNLFDCIECGCCTSVCPSQIPLVQYYRYTKAEIRSAEQAQRHADQARQRFEFRAQRLAENKRKLAETRRKKREALATKKNNIATNGTEKAKPDPIQAALERVRAKQAAKKSGPAIAKKNTDHLTPVQQRQIDDTDKRRNSKKLLDGTGAK